MNFGEWLRDTRQARRLTQPELADAIGIEQSFLSKLETGRSLPSDQTLARILEVFEVALQDMLASLDERGVRELSNLTAVREHLVREEKRSVKRQRRWLLGTLCIACSGIALIYAGYVRLLFPDTYYQYQSQGVVLPGEPREIFEQYRRYLPPGASTDHNAMQAHRDSIHARIDEAFINTPEFRGTVYNVAVPGGSRTYFLVGETNIDPAGNRLIASIGVLLTLLGAGGLLLERRLRL